MKNSDMTIGNMVRVSTHDEDNRHVYYDQIGLIVGTWKNHKNKLQTLDVLLGNGEIKNVGPWSVGMISESR